MTRFALGLGSNQGDRLGHLRTALQQLQSEMDVIAVSSLYETEPIGGPEQGPFLNAVAVVDTDLSPQDLLALLQRFESEAGRQRVKRWGPRTLDLDILVSDGLALSTDDLVIPHPRATEREFVLRPLSEVWPDAPVDGLTAREALRTTDAQGVDLLRRQWSDDSDRWVGWVLVAIQLAWFIAIALAFAGDGGLPGESVRFTHILGGGLAFAGLILALWASRRLGPALTAVPEPMSGSQLIETGPYALARHPIYGGIVLFLAGTALFLDSVRGLGLVLGLGIFFVFKSSYEERRLRARYAGYRAYRRRVRHRLIPFLL